MKKNEKITHVYKNVHSFAFCILCCVILCSCTWNHAGGLYSRTVVFDNPTSWMDYYNSDYVDFGYFVDGDKNHLMLDTSSSYYCKREWVISGLDYCYLNGGESKQKPDTKHYMHVGIYDVYEHCELPFSYDSLRGWKTGEVKIASHCGYYLTFLPVKASVDALKLNWSFWTPTGYELEYNDKEPYLGSNEKPYRFLLGTASYSVAIIEIHGIPLDEYDYHIVDEEARDDLLNRLTEIRENILSVYRKQIKTIRGSTNKDSTQKQN